jgi:FtsP/CotA-like multicopper oxidase with cupredoxin domain
MSATRREFLKSGALGAATVAAGTGLGSLVTGGAVAAAPVNVALVATDGYITLPGRPDVQDLYVFGFKRVPTNTSVSDLVNTYKGNVQHPAPILDFTQEADINIEVTNLGMQTRPDLSDSHTLHWHGFRTPLAVFDGVPEVSIAVPELRKFTYAYRPHDPGTYMYHCHFEDVEHVQMGMTGVVFVRPTAGANLAYNSGGGSGLPNTSFDRQFPILLGEIWTKMHDNGNNIQETVHTDYDPEYFTLNGRVYPQTVLPNNDPSLPNQPISALIQVNAGDRALLRLSSLGYQQHAMQLPGIPMRVVGQDANLLRSYTTGADLSYLTDTLYIGPGEARDVIFTAPLFNANNQTGTDGVGTYNQYFFRNHDARKLANPGSSKLGGMATEVRVYPAGTLGTQTEAGQTYA